MSESEGPRVVRPISGIKKASVLLVALGTEMSSAVLQQLSPDEIERITSEIVMLNRIEPEVRHQVLEECRKSLMEESGAGGADYARGLLEQVVGEEKAKEMLNKVGSVTGTGAFRWLRSVPARQLATAINGEKPQVIALVVGHLPPELAAQVLAALPDQIQGEVALRLTTMQPMDPDVVKNVAEIMLQRLSMTDNATFTEIGGNKSMVRILNNVDRTTEKKILDYLTEANEEIANDIKQSMFVFEDIGSLDDRSIQVILRDVPQEDLRLALKGSSQDMKEVFFRNMSQRAVETIKDDLEATGPVKLREVEGAQTRIAGIARQLDEAGEITLRGGGDEMLV